MMNKILLFNRALINNSKVIIIHTQFDKDLSNLREIKNCQINVFTSICESSYIIIQFFASNLYKQKFYVSGSTELSLDNKTSSKNIDSPRSVKYIQRIGK